MRQNSAEAEVLHDALDGDLRAVRHRLRQFTDLELWALHDACLQVTEETGDRIRERLMGREFRPDGSRVIGGTSS